ncbi:MAG: hypothetical protein ACRDGU_09625 [Actinomycetota bacterium]
MSERWVRLVLRADAVFDAIVGVLLLSATWQGLYRALDLPRGQPELAAQIAGAVLLFGAYLLWVAPTDPALTRHVAGASAFGNALSALIVLAWLAFGELGVGTLGTTLLWIITVVLVVFAALQASIALRARRSSSRPAIRPG